MAVVLREIRAHLPKNFVRQGYIIRRMPSRWLGKTKLADQLKPASDPPANQDYFGVGYVDDENDPSIAASASETFVNLFGYFTSTTVDDKDGDGTRLAIGGFRCAVNGTKDHYALYTYAPDELTYLNVSFPGTVPPHPERFDVTYASGDPILFQVPSVADKAGDTLDLWDILYTG